MSKLQCMQPATLSQLHRSFNGSANKGRRLIDCRILLTADACAVGLISESVETDSEGNGEREGEEEEPAIFV